MNWDLPNDETHPLGDEEDLHVEGPTPASDVAKDRLRNGREEQFESALGVTNPGHQESPDDTVERSSDPVTKQTLRSGHQGPLERP